ncbi:hypothetical protein QUB00_20535 [Microcoleus sp. F8_C2]
MPKNIKKMTYGQLQDEHETNELAKNQLKAEAKKETNSKVLLRLSQQILALAQRNEELVKQQLVLMRATLTDLKTQESEPEPRQVTVSKKGKLKKPLDMSIDELQAEIESNNTRCEKLEEQRKSTDIDKGIEADQELRTLSSRTKKLCEQKISLLTHEMSLLNQGKL